MTSRRFVTFLLICLAAGCGSRIEVCDRATFESLVRSSGSPEETVDLCGAYWLGITAEDRRNSLNGSWGSGGRVSLPN